MNVNVPARWQVLVVDDDPDYRLMTRIALAGSDAFSVIAEAADGEEAAAMLGDTGCEPDLVLFECSSPRAFAGLEELRHRAPKARVVLVSGYDPDDLRLASQATGAHGYLPKTTPARVLGTELQALVGLVDAVQSILEEARTRFGKDSVSPRAARRFVREALEMWALDDMVDAVTLLVSELVTNSVVHAESEVEVLVRLTPDAARIEVTDSSDRPLAPRDPGDSDTSGRGLGLVESVARRWGVRPVPSGGKTVWFEIER